MKRIIILIIAAWGIFNSAGAQQTLEQCRQKARDNYPLVRKYGLITAARDYNIENVSKGNLPQFTLSAKASYQSEVTKIPLKIAGLNISSVSRDQYQASLDIKQNIWDGGRMASQKKMAEASADVEREKNNVDLYDLNQRIDQIYFGILLIDEQLKQNQLLMDDLDRNYKQIDSYYRNGVANESDLDAVRAEQLDTKQRRIALTDNRSIYIGMLSLFLGEQIASDANFQKPIDKEPATEINRPELQWFNSQEAQLKRQREVLDAALKPHLGLFAQGSYGRPGLNTLNNNFRPYYLVGIKFEWNLDGYYTRKNDRLLLDNSKTEIDNARDVFLFNTRMQVAQQTGNVSSMRRQMQEDDEIIVLRDRICKAGESKVAHGTLSVTELLRMINAKDQARQTKALHEIELLSDIYQIKYTTNQ
jgi:outer membrane protein TolC